MLSPTIHRQDIVLNACAIAHACTATPMRYPGALTILGNNWLFMPCVVRIWTRPATMSLLCDQHDIDVNWLPHDFLRACAIAHAQCGVAPFPDWPPAPTQ